ncbi:MAG: hypothetical protein ABIG64_06435 [Candidatus Omnitrophota bacterium]
MKKYIVDTSIINRLVDGHLSIADLPQKAEFFSTHIQIDEINKTPDGERRAQLFLTFAKQNSNIVPTKTTVCGVSRLDNCCLGEGKIYKKIKNILDSKNKNKNNNIQDALIAEIAIVDKMILLTSDWDLKEAVETLNGTVIYFGNKKI